jgi:hypothetical protein
MSLRPRSAQRFNAGGGTGGGVCVAVDCDTPRDMRRPQIVCVATGSGKELRARFEYNGTVKLADGTLAISALQERPYLRVQPEARSARTAGSRAQGSSGASTPRQSRGLWPDSSRGVLVSCRCGSLVGPDASQARSGRVPRARAFLPGRKQRRPSKKRPARPLNRHLPRRRADTRVPLPVTAVRGSPDRARPSLRDTRVETPAELC